MPFNLGDNVKPKPGWDKDIVLADGKHSALPAGPVTETIPWGNGQLIRVAGEPRAYESACFDLVTVEPIPTQGAPPCA